MKRIITFDPYALCCFQDIIQMIYIYISHEVKFGDMLTWMFSLYTIYHLKSYREDIIFFLIFSIKMVFFVAWDSINEVTESIMLYKIEWWKRIMWRTQINLLRIHNRPQNFGTTALLVVVVTEIEYPSSCHKNKRTII